MSSFRHNVMTIFLHLQGDIIARFGHVSMFISPDIIGHQKGSDIAAAALFLLLQGNMIARYHLTSCPCKVYTFSPRRMRIIANFSKRFRYICRFLILYSLESNPPVRIDYISESHSFPPILLILCNLDSHRINM